MRIMYISDYIYHNTGVGTQSNRMINKLICYDDIEIVSVGIVGKMFDGFRVKEVNNKLKVITAPTYESVDFFEYVAEKESIDKIVIITDPRFYFEFFSKFKKYSIPIIYWHVWDNYPYPFFNADIYYSCEGIACISKLTYDCVKAVCDKFKDKYANSVMIDYVPHFYDNNEYYAISRSKFNDLRRGNKIGVDDFVILFNSINMHRKNLQLVIKAFSSFVKEHKDSVLIIKTVSSEIGFDISVLLDYFDCVANVRVIDTNEMDIGSMRSLYNMSNCVVNASHAEGFGLSILESLCCGVPVIIVETGGLVDSYNCGTNDIIDQNDTCVLKTRGISIKPAYRKFVSSYAAPYIYDDYISDEQLYDAFKLIYKNRNIYDDMTIRNKISNDTFENFNDNSVVKLYNMIKNSSVSDNKYFMNSIRVISSGEMIK